MQPIQKITSITSENWMLLALTSLDWPYTHYQILRWVVCGCAVYLAVLNDKKRGWGGLTAMFGIIALTYNPIAPFHLSRDTWFVINLLTMVVLLGDLARRLRAKRTNS